MISKNCVWAFLGLCSLLSAGAPTVTQAAEPPAEAASNAKQGTLVCRNVDIPGSHIKRHVCGTPAQLSADRTRRDLLRQNPAASHVAARDSSIYGPGMSGFSTVASQADFQRR